MSHDQRVPSRPVPGVVPERVHQYANRPEYGDVTGEPSGDDIAYQKGVMQPPSEYGERDDRKHNVESVDPKYSLVERRKFRDVPFPVQPAWRLETGDQH